MEDSTLIAVASALPNQSNERDFGSSRRHPHREQKFSNLVHFFFHRGQGREVKKGVRSSLRTKNIKLNDCEERFTTENGSIVRTSWVIKRIRSIFVRFHQTLSIGVVHISRLRCSGAEALSVGFRLSTKNGANISLRKGQLKTVGALQMTAMAKEHSTGGLKQCTNFSCKNPRRVHRQGIYWPVSRWIACFPLINCTMSHPATGAVMPCSCAPRPSPSIQPIRRSI